MFSLISDWLRQREGWTPRNIDRLGFEIAPLPGSIQGIDPVSFRMRLEAIIIRDLQLFIRVPVIRNHIGNYYNYEIAKHLIGDLISEPDNEILFQMALSYFTVNNRNAHHADNLLENALSRGLFALARKVLLAFAIPLNVKRNLLHYPFDQSILAYDEGKKREIRGIMFLLDPSFRIPDRLQPTKPLL